MSSHQINTQTFVNNKTTNELVSSPYTNFNCEKVKKTEEHPAIHFGIEKNKSNNNESIERNYNNEILRFYKTEHTVNIFKPNEINHSQTSDTTQTNTITYQINEINIDNKIHNNGKVSGEKNTNEKENISKKIIWEFGKSGIKIEKLKKYQSRNLAIFFYLNSIFIDFIDYYPGINLSDIIEKFNDPLINTQCDITKCLYWNNFGSILLKSNELFVRITRDKLNGIYKILDCGYFKFYDVDIDDDILNKFKIPNLNSLLAHNDNTKHLVKILKILQLAQTHINTHINTHTKTNLFKTKSNFLNQMDFEDVIKYLLPEIINKINNKEDIFKLSNNFTFYIKMYDTHTKAFLIDKSSKLIYYWISIENFSKPMGYLFMYVMELDSKYKILNLEKNFTNKESSEQKIHRKTMHINKTDVPNTNDNITDKQSENSDLETNQNLISESFNNYINNIITNDLTPINYQVGDIQIGIKQKNKLLQEDEQEDEQVKQEEDEQTDAKQETQLLQELSQKLIHTDSSK